MISRPRSTRKFITAKSSNFSLQELWPLISENAHFLENYSRQSKSLNCKNDQQAKIYKKVYNCEIVKFSLQELWPLISKNAHFLENYSRQSKSLNCKNDQQAKIYKKVYNCEIVKFFLIGVMALDFRKCSFSRKLFEIEQKFKLQK